MARKRGRERQRETASQTDKVSLHMMLPSILAVLTAEAAASQWGRGTRAAPVCNLSAGTWSNSKTEDIGHIEFDQ